MKRPGNRTLAVVAVCLALLAAGGVVAVRATAWHGSVTLLANWTGTSETTFRDEVIAPFERKEHIHVLYQGSSAESQVLQADVESGTAPDVAVLPGPGELAAYAAQGRLQPLDGLVRPQDFDAPWAPKVPGKDRKKRTYWVPIKTDLKSLVWHAPAAGTTQADLKAAAADPASWCLGMGAGATSGWPGTDWMEDILLQQTGWQRYQQWATGNLPWTSDEVRHAWQTFGAMVGAGQRKYAYPALTTEYDAVAAGVPEGKCGLEHQASFVRHENGWVTAGAAYTPSQPLIPPAAASTDAKPAPDTWEVSGDLAAVLTTSSRARKLIAYLARPDVQEQWSLSQYGFSADRRVPLSAYAKDPVTGKPDPVSESLAAQLRDPKAERCYDASDAMPSKLRDAFDVAVLRFLADPDSLDGQLRNLEKIRQQPKGPTGNTWLPSVCGSG